MSERDSAYDDSRPLSLVEFARLVKDGRKVSQDEYLAQMRRVLPIDELRNLTGDEIEWFHMAVSWLFDYSVLLFEFSLSEKGEKSELCGSPWLPGISGPYIDHMLTRPRGEKPDFTQLETFGARKVAS